jgi:hypothetical protein
MPRVEEDFVTGDWRIRIALLVGFRSNQEARRIAVWGGMGGRFLGAARSPGTITRALDLKARRYGVLSHPYIISVFDRTDSIGFFSSDFISNVAEVLFGSEVTLDVVLEDGGTITRDAREPDGWFGTPQQPINTGVSAVIIFPKTDLWKLAEERFQPVLVKNPWAQNVLAGNPLQIRELEASNEYCRLIPGRLLSEILDLPQPWPPEH